MHPVSFMKTEKKLRLTLYIYTQRHNTYISANLKLVIILVLNKNELDYKNIFFNYFTI